MAKKFENHTFAGLQRDVSVSKHPVTFLYDARNIRLTARDGKDTLLSITNEKGTEDTKVTIQGTYIGHCLLNNYLVVFSADKASTPYADYIYRIDLSVSSLTKVTLFKGNLNFQLDHLLDTVGSFESEEVQKVYWTDNYNQPRFINIRDVNKHPKNQSYNNNIYTGLDFVRTLHLAEDVKIKKHVDSSGSFASGVIQYAFTYYDKYGQESNIFYTSPLLYISPFDRGARPDEKVSNSFEISINNVDPDFDYLRIYSIQRTSINTTPICKRVQDMDIRKMNSGSSTGFKKMVYVDNGFSGDSIDPTELLYKGGEVVKAETIEQKDGTLFLGGITIERDQLESIQDGLDTVRSGGTNYLSAYTRTIFPNKVSKEPYDYANQLTSFDSNGNSVPCGGFKYNEWYRCGIQFQHETGKWSDPIYVNDYKIAYHPDAAYNSDPNYNPNNPTGHVQLQCIELQLPKSYTNIAYEAGYRRVRPVVVFPEIQDRNVICQGVLNPTVYTEKNQAANNPHVQSSWFFRPKRYTNTGSDGWLTSVWQTPSSGDLYGYLTYTQRNIAYNIPEGSNTLAFEPRYLRDVEIEGDFKDENKFQVTGLYSTFHSPDVEFDINLPSMNFIGLEGNWVSNAQFKSTMSDINIQTESPTVSNAGSGFVHMSHTSIDGVDGLHGSEGIVAGLFYDDYVVDDKVNGDRIAAYPDFKQSAKWLVYPWQGSGSINNDINRPADKGTSTSILKKKVISNLRYALTSWKSSQPNNSCVLDNIRLFSSEDAGMEKVGDKIYQGNIDTVLTPDNADGKYFAFEGFSYTDLAKTSESTTDDTVWKTVGESWLDKSTPFESNKWWKTWSFDPDLQKQNGLRIWFKYNGSYTPYYPSIIPSADSTVQNPRGWAWVNDNIADEYVDLVMKKHPVRMRYKSAPHLILELDSVGSLFTTNNALPIIDIRRSSNPTNRFGGKSKDALMANDWIPCGEPTSISSASSGIQYIHYLYGDSYYQRYDCLKTYPFTPEDPNQIVEIGSFMLETRVNIDGRYDRNRGQSNNLNMSPRNFNLMNLVYSQQDNFFSYKIMDDDFYTNLSFPNQITWTKEKQTNADVDLWTNVTLASTYDMDGSKGAITSLNTWKDQIFCFQNKGVSNILFNSRVQIPASDGVPIEISNSYKVDGYRYISDGIGCNTKLQVKETTSGIYFIDSVSGHLHHVGDGIRDVAAGSNMTTWFREHGKDTQRLFYDDVNHDLYVVQENTALCFSELLSQFTSFMDYGNTSLIESCDQNVFTMKDGKLFKMFSGEYCDFFGTYQTVNNEEVYVPNNKPWGLTFISNGSTEGMTDKVFTNLEFRACVDGDGTIETIIPTGETEPVPTGKFILDTPIDYIETWNEYQHGFGNLEDRNGNAGFQHHDKNGNATLKRKFRIWRCDIPRNNCLLDSGTGSDYRQAGTTYPYSLDSDLGISRKYRKSLDRMRNPWLYIKLQKNAATGDNTLKRTELHDMMVTYFD